MGNPASLDCENLHYDLWSFTGVVDGYAYVSVDTLIDKTTFNPKMIVMDDTTCILGTADDSFECTYPPSTKHSCPSYKVSTGKRAQYHVLVQALGDCAATNGEYLISVAAGSDPGLTQEISDAPFYDFETVSVVGTAHLP